MSQDISTPAKESSSAIEVRTGSIEADKLGTADVADRLLEDNPLTKLVKEIVEPLLKYKRTRQAIRIGRPLYDSSREELTHDELMGPWTFSITKFALAAVPTVLVIKMLSLFWPFVPQVSPTLSPLTRKAVELEPSVINALQPFMVPLVLMIMAAACARGSLHGSDSTKAKRRRAKYAYLYFDGSRGLLPQFTLGLVITLSTWLAQRDAWTVQLALFVGILSVYSWIHLIYIQCALEPKFLFKLNGYSEKAVHFWTPRKSQPTNAAPWTKYSLAVLFGAPILVWLAMGAFLASSLAIAFGLAAIGLRAG